MQATAWPYDEGIERTRRARPTGNLFAAIGGANDAYLAARRRCR
jgi:hypothetical protein